MQTRDTIDPHQLLSAYQHHMRAGTDDGEVFCELGPLLRDAGKPQEARRCYKRALEIMQAAARRGDANLALHLEQGIYINFVRAVETEEHYYRSFSDWREELARLGRRHRDPRGWPDADPKRVGFVLVNGFRLAHTKVLLRVLSAYAGTDTPGLQATVYVIDECSDEFAAECAALGVQLVSALRQNPAFARAGLADKIFALRDLMRADRIGCAVWVSVPAAAAFSLSMGLAPVQAFWALRFHPVTGPYIDGYLTYGAPGEKERRFGKQAWQVVPAPLAIDQVTQADPARIIEIRAIRALYPERFLYGTVAREDKIRSTDFLEAVAAILKARPDAGYVWTGRSRDPQIAAFFETQGVASRCHFAGWVDASLYGAAFDAFLETFPLGCGLTGYQALGAGTPVLSFLAENTIFGMQFWDSAGLRDPVQIDLSAYPVLCARFAQEYVQIACRLADDGAFRAEAGARGRTFFEREISQGATQARRFFEALGELISRKATQPA